MVVNKITEKVEDIIVEGQGSWECEHDCADYEWSGNSDPETEGCSFERTVSSKITSWW